MVILDDIGEQSFGHIGHRLKKDGEVAAQCADMLVKMSIPVAIIDDAGVFPPDKPHKVSINPLGAVPSTYKRNPQDLVFSSENVNHALVPEPPNDARNQYWRDEPRSLIEFCTYVLLKRNPKLAVPGGVWALLSDPAMMAEFAAIEAEEGDEMLQALARNVIEMSDHEHFAQHRSAAIKSLRIFCAGSRLHKAGSKATTTHAELIAKKAVIFLVGPQAFMNRLGSYYALHILAFNEALYSGAGPLWMILDEFTNAPLKPLVEALTTLRAYGGECAMIAQSRSEIERRFGKLETQTIEENAIVKQWFGFSSFDEAERVSKAMGEEAMISSTLGADNRDTRLQSNPQLGKQRLMTPAELMAMSQDTQLIHIKGIGFFTAKKIAQNNIAPFCHAIGPNPLEGGRLPPEPMLTLTR